MKIILHIPVDVDPDGVHCGNCQFLSWMNSFQSARCCLFFNELSGKSIRLPECLKAEVEAKEKT
jgi:hypothetical protein